MRVNVQSVIFSLVAASTVIAAPTPIGLEKRNLIIDKLKPLITNAFKSLECGACVAAMVGVKDAAFVSNSLVLTAAKSLCSTIAKKPVDVCNGMVDLYGPVLLNVLSKADITGGDGKLLCHSLGGICPAPPVTSGTLTFPKPRPANAVAPTSSGQIVDVLHLSDWHVDEQFAPGTEALCGGPLCCRKSTGSPATTPLNRSAASWGDYNCDSPVKLTQDLMGFVTKVGNFNFTIMTGDVPPHDVWLENQDTVGPIEMRAFDEMAAALPTIKVYPTVGNHESGPASLFPTVASGGDSSKLYAGLADDWSRWLPADAVASVKNYGAYTVSPTPGFRIISLNTNFCYTVNIYLYANTKDFDPNGELNWLVKQLQAAEDAGERVWIIGHVGPSLPDCLQNWSALYYQVVQRYSPHVIAEQFFGHTHYDEFSLFYGPGGKSAQNAIATSWTGPSVTPYTNVNPGFRVYKVDTKSWNIFDSETYVADLSQAASWDASGSTPNWHLEYSARKAYGAYVPIAADAPLSAAWWHNVTRAFESTDAAFQQYWTFRGKSANLQGACPIGSICATQLICNLRAGKSADACTTPMVNTHKRDVNEVEAMEADAKDPSGLYSLYKRPEVQLWDQKLCGMF